MVWGWVWTRRVSSRSLIAACRGISSSIVFHYRIFGKEKGAPPTYRAHGRVVEQSRAKRETLRKLHATLSTVLGLEASLEPGAAQRSPLRCGEA